MRKFKVLVDMEIHAESFAGAEREVHRIMSSYFASGDGDNPKHFMTLGILKGARVENK